MPNRGLTVPSIGNAINIVNYAKAEHAQQVLVLFKEIYPEWDDTLLNYMAYDENHPAHLQTKLAIEAGFVIGQANAFWLDREKRIANLGYHLHPGYQRQGLGYRLAQALIADLSNQVDYFVVLTTADNRASQKLCEKLGFTPPPDEIRAVITQTEKYKKIPSPYLRALAIKRDAGA